MNELLIKWLQWYRKGLGADSKGVDPDVIIATAKSLNLKEYQIEGEDWRHVVLRECIRRNKTTKRRQQRKSKEEYKSYATQRTDKGFFNIVTKRS